MRRKKMSEDERLLARVNRERKTTLITAAAAMCLCVAIMAAFLVMYNNMTARALGPEAETEEEFAPVSADKLNLGTGAEDSVSREKLDEILSAAPSEAVRAADEALGGQGTAEEWVDAITAADPDFAETAGEILGR